MGIKVTGIYLAAGQSRRMQRPKLSIQLGKKDKLGALALEIAAKSRLHRIITVTRGGGIPDWFPSFNGENAKCGRCSLVAAENAGLGMAHSLHAGLDAAVEREAPDAIIVLLADQPFIHERMINRLIETFEADLTLDYVASGDQGIPKPPVLLASSMFGALRKLQGDEGARKLLMKPGFRGLVLEEQDPWCFADLDTPEDIERYKKRTI